MNELKNTEKFKHKPVAETKLAHDLALLRTWQSERLARTYADLLTDVRYRPACLFFLEDIYAPRDFSQRDHDIARLHTLLSSILPPRIVQILKDGVELTQTTNSLDDQLVSVLVNQLGVTESISAAQYAEGYRLCNNYAEREHQIDLIVKVLNEVGALAHLPMVNIGIKLAGGFADRLGWHDIYGFLQRGHDAFKKMRDVPFFASTIEQREKQILKQIWDKLPDPFAL